MLSRHLTPLIKDYIEQIDDDLYTVDFTKHPALKDELIELLTLDKFDVSIFDDAIDKNTAEILIIYLRIFIQISQQLKFKYSGKLINMESMSVDYEGCVFRF